MVAWISDRIHSGDAAKLSWARTALHNTGTSCQQNVLWTGVCVFVCITAGDLVYARMAPINEDGMQTDGQNCNAATVDYNHPALTKRQIFYNYSLTFTLSTIEDITAIFYHTFTSFMLSEYTLCVHSERCLHLYLFSRLLFFLTPTTAQALFPNFSLSNHSSFLLFHIGADQIHCYGYMLHIILSACTTDITFLMYASDSTSVPWSHDMRFIHLTTRMPTSQYF